MNLWGHRFSWNSNQNFSRFLLYLPSKAITSVGCPKMKRDAWVKAVFFLRKKTAFTQASLFILGRRTGDMVLLYFKTIKTYRDLVRQCRGGLKSYLTKTFKWPLFFSHQLNNLHSHQPHHRNKRFLWMTHEKRLVFPPGKAFKIIHAHR